MINKTFSAATQYTEPIFLRSGRIMAISLSGTFVGTIKLQRLMQDEGAQGYPGHGDAGWNDVTSYTTPTETRIEIGDNCWYRGLCSAYTSGSPVLKMRI